VNERDRLAALQAENDRLAALLDSHGISWRQSAISQSAARDADSIPLSPDAKVALFRRLFRGRLDVYPVRWESRRPARLATPLLAAMSGGPVFVKSLVSSAATVATVC
jgi:hypothetical protein